MKKDALPGSSVVLEAGGRIPVVLIEEGRSQNGNHWSREMLKKVAGLAEGVPVSLYDFSGGEDKSHLSHWGFIYRILPPAIRRMLPERLEDAALGTIKGAQYKEPRYGKARVEGYLEPDEGKGTIARQLLEMARRLGKRIGLSIHLPEDGFQDRVRGNGDSDVVNVSRIVGFDVVSCPSAGGRILPVLEALARRRTEMKDFLRRLLRLVPEDKRAALEALFPEDPETVTSAEGLLEAENEDLAKAMLEALEMEDIDEEAVPIVLEALAKRAPKETPAKKKKTSIRRRRATDTDPDPDPDPAPDKRIDGILEAQKKSDERLLAIELRNGRQLIEAVVDGSKIPEGLATFAKEKLEVILEAAGSIEKKEIDGFIKDLKKGLGSSQANGGGLLEGAGGGGSTMPHISQDWTTFERMECALEAMLCSERFGVLEAKDGKKTKVPAFHGIKQAYQYITGDYMMEGLAYVERLDRRPPILEGWDFESNPFFMSFLKMGGRGLEATIVTTNFTAILSNIQNKRLMREYDLLPHTWKLIATTANVNDFKARTINRLGEYASLPTVAQDGPYNALAEPSEESVSASIAKRGGTGAITWESIVDDDLRAFRGIPGKLARAADRTLNDEVWDKVLSNTDWGHDSVALFHADHANLVAALYTFDVMLARRTAMSQQQDMDDIDTLKITARTLFCGPAMIDEIYEDIYSDGRPYIEVGVAAARDTENAGKPNVARGRYGLEVREIQEFADTAGSETDVILAASPQETEMLEVGFLNGKETPEIFIQDMEKVGTFFTNDRVTYKVRHVHDDGVIVDPRGLQLMQAP